jgi:beta-lactamase regulating signal transducer with metallopeptidase domain
MMQFFIQSTLSLFLLLMVYHLFLEKERMHQFKRFYLLFSLVFSLVIPFITIAIASEITQPIRNSTNLLFAHASSQIIVEKNYTPYLLWVIYALVTLICSIRFINNILKITSKTKTNRIIDYYGAKLVLIPEKNLPHTFLNYIFINETDYKNRNIEAELYTHELTHVTQKHSFDILLIEFLKTIFWFNPIFIFYKKAIQLNHEFLADEFVIHYYEDIPFYQSLLVSKANISQPLYLVSNLNFLVTKKRLLMMTKTTTQAKAILKQLALIPVFAILFYSISFKSVAMENPTPHSIQTKSQDSKNKFTKKNIVLEKEVIQNTAVAKSSISNNGTNLNKLTDSTARKTQSINDITQPEFPGGIVAFYKFIGSNFKVPTELKGGGKIHLTFIVEKDGSLSEFEFLKDVEFGTGEEVIRVLKLSPKWIPAKENNETVRVKYSLPIQVEAEK